MKPIVLKIKSLSASERRITAEIIDCIREIDLLKIHLEMGYPSLMEFLVRECGYSETAALRRIDAARIVNVIPEVRADLKSGSLNLSQVSIVAQSVRQKEKLGEKVTLDKKIEVLNAVKHLRTFEVQKIAAQILDLPVQQTEKVKVQADESVRIELSLSKSEMEILQKAKELLGHVRPGMSIKELVVLMAERTIKTRDPAREVRSGRRNRDICKGANLTSIEQVVEIKTPVDQAWNQRTLINQASEYRAPANHKGKNELSINSKSATEFKKRNAGFTKRSTTLANPHESARVSASARRQVFQRDRNCQWVNPNSGKKCGSRHLLEIDHKISRWAGGGNELENLELKCRAHNRWKYRVESGIRAAL